mmetsp:Transcript_8570/g.12579  ORF Transcript_8570/g.12579 Transcript_8570/m.12579 type:complete len:119 (-) Transcript_8570:278-634(-)
MVLYKYCADFSTSLVKPKVTDFLSVEVLRLSGLRLLPASLVPPTLPLAGCVFGAGGVEGLCDVWRVPPLSPSLSLPTFSKCGDGAAQSAASLSSSCPVCPFRSALLSSSCSPSPAPPR